MVRESLRSRGGGPRRNLAALHEPAPLRREWPSACTTSSAARRGSSTWSATRSTDALPLPPQRRRRLRVAAARRGADRSGLGLHGPQSLRDAARAVSDRPSTAPGSSSSPTRISPASARRRCGACSSSSGLTTTTAPSSSPGSGRRARQAGWWLRADGPRRAPAGSAGASTAISTGCPNRFGGWSSASSTTPARARRRSRNSIRRCARGSSSSSLPTSPISSGSPGERSGGSSHRLGR